jgi:hypothetical protein
MPGALTVRASGRIVIHVNTAQYFDGSFEFLPVRSQLDAGPLPAAAGGAFENAVSALRCAELDAPMGAVTWAVAAARWRVEAIRERRMHGEGACVTSPAVFARVAAALVEWSRSNG